VRSDVIVISSIGLQDAAQMRLAQDGKVVHTLASDRSDQSFSKTILPRRVEKNSLLRNLYWLELYRVACLRQNIADAYADKKTVSKPIIMPLCVGLGVTPHSCLYKSS
jgi:hypothetical protein